MSLGFSHHETSLLHLAVHSARAVPSLESQREDVKNLTVTPARAALPTKLQSKMDAVNVAPSPLLVFFRWRLAGAGARCQLQQRRGTPTLPKSSSQHPPLQPAGLWDPAGEHFKLTDVWASLHTTATLLHRPGA